MNILGRYEHSLSFSRGHSPSLVTILLNLTNLGSLNLLLRAIVMEKKEDKFEGHKNKYNGTKI